MQLVNAVGDTVRRLRQEQGLTLRDLASMKHVSIGYLSEVERGHKQVSYEILESLATGLQFSTAGFLKEVYEYMEEHNV